MVLKYDPQLENQNNPKEKTLAEKSREFAEKLEKPSNLESKSEDIEAKLSEDQICAQKFQLDSLIDDNTDLQNNLKNISKLLSSGYKINLSGMSEYQLYNLKDEKLDGYENQIENNSTNFEKLLESTDRLLKTEEELKNEIAVKETYKKKINYPSLLNTNNDENPQSEDKKIEQKENLIKILEEKSKQGIVAEIKSIWNENYHSSSATPEDQLVKKIFDKKPGNILGRLFNHKKSYQKIILKLEEDVSRHGSIESKNSEIARKKNEIVWTKSDIENKAQTILYKNFVQARLNLKSNFIEKNKEKGFLPRDVVLADIYYTNSMIKGLKQDLKHDKESANNIEKTNFISDLENYKKIQKKYCRSLELLRNTKI